MGLERKIKSGSTTEKDVRLLRATKMFYLSVGLLIGLGLGTLVALIFLGS